MTEQIIPIGLREVYHKKGTFEFKIQFDLSKFSLSSDRRVFIRDSSGTEIKINTRVWGSKLCCEFTIDDEVADGVSMVSVEILDRKQNKCLKNFKFWVIK